MRNQITHTEVRATAVRALYVLVVVMRFIFRAAWLLVLVVLRVIGSIFRAVESLAKVALVLAVVAAVVGR